MNNSPRRKRVLRPMIMATMSAYEIEQLTAEGKKIVEAELAVIRKNTDAESMKKH